MGLTWRTLADGTADAVEWDAFAEVVYEDDEILALNVARGMAVDGELEDDLVDTLARSGRRDSAQAAITLIAAAHGLDVYPDETGSQLAMTLAPPWAPGRGA